MRNVSSMNGNCVQFHKQSRSTRFQPVPDGVVRGSAFGNSGASWHGLKTRATGLAVILLVAVLGTQRALGHGDDEPTPQNFHELWHTWAFEPGIVIPLLLSAWLYIQGLARLWGASGIGHGIRKWEAASFAGGWFALVVALVSPLHPWGRALFSAHMAQHEILMLVAAPLLVLGRPMIVFLKALPAGWANALARAGNAPAWQRIWR